MREIKGISKNFQLYFNLNIWFFTISCIAIYFAVKDQNYIVGFLGIILSTINFKSDTKPFVKKLYEKTEIKKI